MITGGPGRTASAHELAGALGSYGRPGSDLMKDVERALRGPVTGAGAADLASRVRTLVAELYGD